MQAVALKQLTLLSAVKKPDFLRSNLENTISENYFLILRMYNKSMKWLLLVIIVIISGCTAIDYDVVQTTQNKEDQGFKDVLVVKDIQIIPRSPLLPDQEFTLFFTLENVDDEKDVKNSEVNIFNPSVFRSSDGISCASDSCNPDICSKGNACNIIPGEQKQIQVNLRAPTEEEIARIKLDTIIHFSIDYNFNANTFFEVPVVTIDEISERQRAGQTLPISSSNVRSSGPIQIDSEIKGTSFVLAGQSANFVFTVKNEGDKNKGNLVKSEVESMEIEFPRQLFDTGSKIDPPDNFNCEALTGRPTAPVKCTNNNAISLFKGVSVPLKFVIEKTRSTDIPPFATYPIKAKIENYNYQVRDSVGITVQPFG
jgi:hypothetical protein